tara:strand:- start:160 stop:483 length:324 start_codon:yes stop_codon:yes gene_type:complete
MGYCSELAIRTFLHLDLIVGFPLLAYCFTVVVRDARDNCRPEAIVSVDSGSQSLLPCYNCCKLYNDAAADKACKTPSYYIATDNGRVSDFECWKVKRDINEERVKYV